MVTSFLNKLYGLPDGNNPYTPKELDPVKDPDQLKLVVRTGPFAAIDVVDAYLDECLQQGTTAFILVTGESWTGRSSVAKAIIAMYREKLFLGHPNERQARFFLPEIPTTELHEDPHRIYSKWFDKLRNALHFKRSQLSPPNEFFAELDKVSATITKDNFDTKLQQLLGDVSILLSSQQLPAGFGLLLEKVPNPGYILAAKLMFEFSRAVCVFTVASGSDEILSVFASCFSNQPPHLIRLEGIDGEVMRILLEKRWNGAGSYPFIDDGIQQAFDKPVPIGKALYIVSSLLEVRANEKKNDPPWPDNTALSFTLDDLNWGMQFFSKLWRR